MLKPPIKVYTFVIVFTCFLTSCSDISNTEFDSVMPIEFGWNGVPWATHYENINEYADIGGLKKRQPDRNGNYYLSARERRSIAGIKAVGRLEFSKSDRFCAVNFFIQEDSLGEDRVKPIIKEFTQKYGPAETNTTHLEWYFKGVKIFLINKSEGGGAGIRIGSPLLCSRAELSAIRKSVEASSKKTQMEK